MGEFQPEDTTLGQDPSGWMTYAVTERKLLLTVVLTTAGDHTTVITTRTCRSPA